MKSKEDIEGYLSTQDQLLGRLIQKYGRCPFLQDGPQSNLFDRLANSIIGQQLSVKAAGSIRATLLAQATSEVFSPAFFLSTTPEDLRSYGLSTAKAKTLCEISTKLRNDPDFLVRMDSLPSQEIEHALCGIKGIGPWTAKMFQIFALRRLDIFAAEDAGLMRGIRITYSGGKSIDPVEIESITSQWSPYRTVGAWYMWQVANAQPQKLAKNS